jgi:hypothetical protein
MVTLGWERVYQEKPKLAILPSKPFLKLATNPV